MSAESMAEFYDAAEQIVSSSDDSEVCMLCVCMAWSDACTIMRFVCFVSVWNGWAGARSVMPDLKL